MGGMKRSVVAVVVVVASMLMLAGPATAFSTTKVAPIRRIPVRAAEDADTGRAGLWATQGVWTKCGAIGVDAVFSNADPRIATGQQTFSISIEIKVKNAWVHVAGSEVESYRPSRQHHRYEFDQSIKVGWHFTYRVLITNHTSAPLLGTVWVNAGRQRQQCRQPRQGRLQIAGWSTAESVEVIGSASTERRSIGCRCCQ